MELISKHQLGDMQVRYLKNEEDHTVDLLILPVSMENKLTKCKFSRGDSLVQLKLVGDPYPGGFASGTSMRNSDSTKRLKFKEQTIEVIGEQNIIKTYLYDDRGYEVLHELSYCNGEKAILINTTFINRSKKVITLEMLSSFSLGEITPFYEGDGHDTLLLHRLKSKWSHEGRLDTVSLEDLQLEPSWTYWSVNSERFGQVGSMPVKKFAPFMAVEDTKAKVIWGVSLGCSSSWQMELYRRDEGVHMSGGIADREFGHWMKNISPDETFVTPTAYVTVASYSNPMDVTNEELGDDSYCNDYSVDLVSQRLTSALDKIVEDGPVEERELPILFNEYCTTWGCPSHENIEKIVSFVKGKGISYFVIDCGWYKPEDGPWYNSMGDYEISPVLFPDGLDKTVSLIKDAGLKPGIWFEIENVANLAKAYNKEEYLLKRDGYVLTTDNRRFWDMTNPYVNQYLTEKVINTLRDYKFEYMKIDYNDTIGLGCDGYESLGEGLRQVIEGSISFIEKVKEEVPGIILENCASGGHRLEPRMMGLMSMASFSDAHECEEIPIIAANLHRLILPRQSQIWAVIHKEDSAKRIAYSLINTFLGRMCLSGDVLELTPEQWEVIDSGISFYKEVAPIIKNGFTYRYGSKITSERHPKGYQAVVRVGSAGTLITIHTFLGELPEYIKILLPKDSHREIEAIYSDSLAQVEIVDNVLCYKTSKNMQGVAIHLS